MRERARVQQGAAEGQATGGAQKFPAGEGQLLGEFVGIGDSRSGGSHEPVYFVNRGARVHSDFTYFRKKDSRVKAKSRSSRVHQAVLPACG